MNQIAAVCCCMVTMLAPGLLGPREVRAEDYSGSLETGKRADFIVLDRNLLEIDEDDIVGTQVLRTVVDGQVVFESEGMN